MAELARDYDVGHPITLSPNHCALIPLNEAGAMSAAHQRAEISYEPGYML